MVAQSRLDRILELTGQAPRRGRQAMTLFFALERGTPAGKDLTTTGAARVLQAAIAEYVQTLSAKND